MMSLFTRFLYPNVSANGQITKWSKTPLSKTRISLLLLHYFIGYTLIYPYIMARITLMLDPHAITVGTPIQLITYAYVLIVTIILIWPLLKESWANMPKNPMQIFRIVTRNMILLYVIYIGMSILLTLVTQQSTSNNQTSITQSMDEQRLLTVGVALLFAPIVEECICRGVVFRTLRSRWGFLPCALISGLVFGLLHCYTSIFTGDFNDLWFILIYGLVGFFMCRAYEQSESIYGAILLHFVYNSIAMLFVL